MNIEKFKEFGISGDEIITIFHHQGKIELEQDYNTEEVVKQIFESYPNEISEWLSSIAND